MLSRVNLIVLSILIGYRVIYYKVQHFLELNIQLPITDLGPVNVFQMFQSTYFRTRHLQLRVIFLVSRGTVYTVRVEYSKKWQ